MRVVVGNPILRATAAATGLWNLFDGARIAVMILFLTRIAGLQAGAVGVMFTLGAVGFLIGSLLPERMARRFGLGRAILLGIVLAVPSELLTAFASGPPTVAAAIAGAGFFLTGLTIPTYDINQFSLRQAVTPLRLQGRVSATMRTLIRGLVPIGALLGGLLAERIGLREVMIVSALGGPAAFLAIWFSPVRSLLAPPPRQTRVMGDGLSAISYRLRSSLVPAVSPTSDLQLPTRLVRLSPDEHPRLLDPSTQSGAGRSQVLAISTCRPSREAVSTACMTSRTW